VVEIYSPCHTHFGKNNRMKETREMLHWLRDKGLSVEKYRRLGPSKEDYFAVGKLVDRDEPDFNARYEEIGARAMVQKG
jgi:2-oxoglutarate ferredoxin oxidoreductase subunit beta